jgi:hypothetical protein
MRLRRKPQLISLLEAISSGRTDLSLNAFDDRIVGWAIQSGLGPLFYRAVKDNPNNLACPHWYALKAADLTARVVTGDHLEAMGEILDACRGQVLPLTLLKGISIAEECYSEPHLRLMRDLDFLVQKESLPSVKATLKQIGYRQRCDNSTRMYETHHHAAPFFHEEKNVWVEVHHSLLSPKREASRDRIFQPETILCQSRPSQFQGREVRRLSFELQLVYLATHWAQDFRRVGGMVGVVDAIYLLKQAGDELCWDWIVNSVRGSIAATYLYLLLSYLDRYRLVEIDPEILHELFLTQPSFGKISLEAAHAIVDRYSVAGARLGRLNERFVTIAWKTLTLPGPAPWSLMRAPLDLFVPSRWLVP